MTKDKFIIEKLLNGFMDSKLRYPMGGNSTEWWIIKTDFDLIATDIYGSATSWQSERLNEIDLLKENENLKLFQIHVLNYAPKDDVEKKEKEIISERIKIGLNIYEELIKIKEENSR